MINVAFIGLGNMGMYQVRAFAKLSSCRIVAGADLAEPSRANFSKTVPQAAVYADHRQMLKNPKIDAVVVAVPTLLHLPIATDVLRSGRPLLLEKPAARTVADCRKLLAVNRRSNRLCMIAHCRRFDSDWGAVAKIVSRGTLGGPILWRDVAAVKGPGGWFMDDRLGGGPMIDGCVHNYDFANMIFGKPLFVVGSGIKLTNDSAVDTANAVVHYEGGNQLMLSWSWAKVAPQTHMREMQGTKAALIFGPGPLASPELDTKANYYHCLVTPNNPPRKLLSGPRKDLYVEQARHFLNCIAGRAQCRTPLEEATKAVAVAEAVLKVARKPGVAPVKY